jgi:hypothetical protein
VVSADIHDVGAMLLPFCPVCVDPQPGTPIEIMLIDWGKCIALTISIITTIRTSDVVARVAAPPGVYAAGTRSTIDGPVAGAMGVSRTL